MPPHFFTIFETVVAVEPLVYLWLNSGNPSIFWGHRVKFRWGSLHLKPCLGAGGLSLFFHWEQWPDTRKCHAMDLWIIAHFCKGMWVLFQCWKALVGTPIGPMAEGRPSLAHSPPASRYQVFPGVSLSYHLRWSQGPWRPWCVLWCAPASLKTRLSESLWKRTAYNIT